MVKFYDTTTKRFLTSRRLIRQRQSRILELPDFFINPKTGKTIVTGGRVWKSLRNDPAYTLTPSGFFQIPKIIVSPPFDLVYRSEIIHQENPYDDILVNVFQNISEYPARVIVSQDNRILFDGLVNEKHRMEYVQFLIDSEKSILEGTITIVKPTPLPAEQILQSFRDDKMSHCLLSPIEKWLHSQAHLCYKKRKELISATMKKYKDGVPETELQSVADTFGVNLKIEDIFGETMFHIKSNRYGQNKNFTFINTRINHLEIIEKTKDEIVHNTQESINKVPLDNSYYFGSFNKPRMIVSPKEIHIYEPPEKKMFKEFEKYVNLRDVKIKSNTPEYNFIKEGVLFSSTTLFNDIKDPICLDMERAYASFHNCEFYEGFPAQIDNLTETNEITDLGYYRVEITHVPIQTDKFFRKMSYCCEGEQITLPSPELKFLSLIGVEYNVLYSATGNPIHFKFTPSMINKKLYAIWTGKQASDKSKNVRLKGNKEFASILQKRFPNDKVVHVDDEIIIIREDKHIYNRAHIVGFITSYTRIQLLQQLLKIPYKDVRFITVDSVVAKTTMKPNKGFREKQFVDIQHSSQKYVEYDPMPKTYDFPKHPALPRVVLLAGQGGSGKTHWALTNPALTDKAYFAPSWKLAREKHSEYGVPVYVHYKLFEGKPLERHPANMIIDEASMLTKKQYYFIVNKYPNSRLIFCGDIGFQIPHIDDDPENELKEEHFPHIIRFTENYRCKDPELQKMLIEMRDCIKNKKPYPRIPDISDENVIAEYQVEDYILCSLRNRVQYFTDNLKHKPNKWLITKTNTKTSTGDVLIQEQKPSGGELRHAFTVHATQGITVKSNLYIDLTYLFKGLRMLYTACSRAEYLSQIKFIKAQSK